MLPTTRIRSSDSRRVPPGIYICYNASTRVDGVQNVASPPPTGPVASHKTLSCNVKLQPPEARLRAPINGFVRVDGIDDVPPGPQAVENAAPRAVRIRLAWDSLTATRPLHTSSIARLSGVGLEDISTSARSL